MNKDKIPGGLAAGKKPTDFPKDKLEAGTKVEMEHTSDRSIAQEIAMDHLTEDMNYYTKLKTIEKQDKPTRVEVAPDGKRELDFGIEPLDKLKNKWDIIKKALDSDKAILDLLSLEYQEPDKNESKSGSTDNSSEPEQAPQQNESQGNNPTQDSQQQVPQQNESPVNNTTADSQQQAPQQNESQGNDPTQDPQQQDASSDTASPPEEQMSEEEIIQSMKDEGYTDEEIAHVVHGHQTPTPTLDDHKMANEKAKGELTHQNLKEDAESERGHKTRMNELAYQKAQQEMADPEVEKAHRKRMLDVEHEVEVFKKKKAELELDHQKKILDLEFNRAKTEAEKKDPTEESTVKQLEFELEMKRMEKQVELDFKKKELALKLKMQEELGRQKMEHQSRQAEDDAVTNAAVKKEQAKHKISEAKKPSQKEVK